MVICIFLFLELFPRDVYRNYAAVLFSSPQGLQASKYPIFNHT